MAVKVSIKQTDQAFSVLSAVAGNNGFLDLVLEAERMSGNTTSAVLALTDNDFDGYTVTLTGTDLTFGSGGLLESGEIDGMIFKNDKGKVVGSITTKEADGLNLDVDDMQAATSPSAVAALLADWQIGFDAKAVPKPKFIWEVIGVTYESGPGSDTITGSRRYDFLYGGGGDDVIDGGAGGDLINGDKTSDLFDTDPSGNDTLKGGDGDDEVIGGGGDDKIYGGEGNDNLSGDDFGKTGADQIFGEDGNDLLAGGEGDDFINGGKGQDRIRVLDEQTGDFVITIDLAAQTSTGQGNDDLVSIEHAWGARWHDNVIIGSKIGNSLIGGDENDDIDGAAGNDRLHGADGTDTVVGGIGNDLIAGGLGNDTLTGDAGEDMFYFAEKGTANIDHIADFSSRDDQLYMYGEAATSIPIMTGKIKADMFKVLANGATVDGSDRYIYDAETGILYFDRDGNGSELRQELLSLEIGTKLSAKDIEIHNEMNTGAFL